jgi:hypothetical protein
LGKKSRLDLRCDFEFPSGATLGFQFLGGATSLFLNFAADFIESHQSKGIPIGVFESCIHSTPRWCFRRMAKGNPAFKPLVVFRLDILREKNNLLRLTD